MLARFFAVILISFLGAILLKLWQFAPTKNQIDWANLQHVLGFTFWQALLSTFLSACLALPLTWAATAGRWQYLRHFLPITTVMPTIIFVWLLLQMQNIICSNCSLYGFHGILIAHVLLNAPLIAFLLLPAVEALPENYRKQKQILNLSIFFYARKIIFPLIKPALNQACILVFLLCFSSFTVPLIFSGSPRYANLELAIYQAIKYEFDLSLAAQLALIQTAFLLIFLAIFPAKESASVQNLQHVRRFNSWASALEALFVVAFLFPIILLFWQSSKHFSLNLSPRLWQALLNSIFLCLWVLPSALFIHLIIVRHAAYSQSSFWLHLMRALYLQPLIILCLGLFLIFLPFFSFFNYPLSANIIMMVLLLQPYLFKLAFPLWQEHVQRTKRLIVQLNLSAWQQFWQIDFPTLAPLISKTTGLAAILCLNEVAAASFFANGNFQTLATYLSSELGHYRQQQAWQTTCILLLLCAVIYAIVHLFYRIYSFTRRRKNYDYLKM